MLTNSLCWSIYVNCDMESIRENLLSYFFVRIDDVGILSANIIH